MEWAQILEERQEVLGGGAGVCVCMCVCVSVYMCAYECVRVCVLVYVRECVRVCLCGEATGAVRSRRAPLTAKKRPLPAPSPAAPTLPFPPGEVKAQPLQAGGPSRERGGLPGGRVGATLPRRRARRPASGPTHVAAFMQE